MLTILALQPITESINLKIVQGNDARVELDENQNEVSNLLQNLAKNKGSGLKYKIEKMEVH